MKQVRDFRDQRNKSVMSNQILPIMTIKDTRKTARRINASVDAMGLKLND